MKRRWYWSNDKTLEDVAFLVAIAFGLLDGLASCTMAPVTGGELPIYQEGRLREEKLRRHNVDGRLIDQNSRKPRSDARFVALNHGDLVTHAKASTQLPSYCVACSALRYTAQPLATEARFPGTTIAGTLSPCPRA